MLRQHGDLVAPLPVWIGLLGKLQQAAQHRRRRSSTLLVVALTVT